MNERIWRDTPRAFFLGATLLVSAACSSAPQPESPAQEPAEAGPEEANQDEAAEKEAEAAERKWIERPAHLQGAAASCKQAGPLPAERECTDVFADLDAALQMDGGARDAALGELEGCKQFPAGLLRALRADLAETECADALTLPALKSEVELDQEVEERLLALTYAAWLRRSARAAPAAPEPHDLTSMKQFFAEEFFPWVTEEASAIYEVANAGSKLGGYGRGIVATEAGMADLRFVQLTRELPLPVEITEHQEAVDVYYQNLDQVLDPRKNRGRDAALVGLRALLGQGILQSARVEAARTLLASLFGGSRLTALDRLMLTEAMPSDAVPSNVEPSDAKQPSTQSPSAEAAASGAAPQAEQAKQKLLTSLAGRLPTAYFDFVFAGQDLQLESLLAALSQGASKGLRARIQSAELTPKAVYKLSQAHLRLGIQYSESQDFQSAYQHTYGFLRLNSHPEELEEELKFQLALSQALMAGPENAVALMAHGPRFADVETNLAALRELSSGPARYNGEAAFNLTYLQELVARSGDPEDWKALEEGYARAARLLQGERRALARKYQEAAAATGKAIREAASAR